MAFLSGYVKLECHLLAWLLVGRAVELKIFPLEIQVFNCPSMGGKQIFLSRLSVGQLFVVCAGRFAGDQQKSLRCSVFLEGGEAGMSGGNFSRSYFNFA